MSKYDRKEAMRKFDMIHSKVEIDPLREKEAREELEKRQRAEEERMLQIKQHKEK